MSHPPHGPNSPTSSPQIRPLHVVHLIKGLGPGGAEQLIVNQLQTGDPLIEYTVLRLLEHKRHLVERVEAAGGSSLLIGGGRFWPFALRKRLRNLSPDVVHAHSPILASAVRVLVRMGALDTAVVTTEHNRWPRHHRLTRLANKVTAPLDHGRIAVSKDVLDSMSPNLAFSTLVLDHGVPVAELAASRTARPEFRARLLGDRADTTTLIGIVANFRPEKAYDVFFAAAQHALAERTDLHFLVIGQGPGEDDFRSMVSSAGLDAHIEVLGYRDDAKEIMSAFDIFTLSSRHEGKPVSMMEAFALGIPVVATKAGGIPEAVTHGEDGLLVELDDYRALADAWIALAADPERREQMSQAAAGNSSRFDAASATKSIESLYRDCVERAG